VTKDRPIKLLMICGNYPPTDCGVGIYTERLVSRLRQRPGLEVTVLTQDRVQRWRVVDLPRILRLIRAARPDIIHLQYPAAAYRRDVGEQYIPILLRVLMPLRPVVVTLHEYHDTSLLGHIRVYGTGLFANRVIVSNRTDRDQLRLLPPWIPPVVIPIGINVGPGCVDSARQAELLRQLGLEAGRFVAYFGLIDPSKGVDNLLSAAAAPDWPADLKLTIIGRYRPDDPYHRQLRRQADQLGGRVVWPEEYLDDRAAASLLAAAAMAVQPFAQPVSLRRSTVLTPLALGVPTITTGPAPAPLQDGVNCVTLHNNSAAQISAQVQRLWDDAELRKILRSNGLDLAKNFDWEKIVSDHVRLYKKLLHRQ